MSAHLLARIAVVVLALTLAAMVALLVPVDGAGTPGARGTAPHAAAR